MATGHEQIGGTEQTDSRIAESSGGLWCAWDIVLAAAVVAWAPLGPFGIGEYLCGLLNDVSLSFDVGFVFLLIGGPLVLFCLVVLVFRMVSTWPEHIAGRKRLWTLRLLVLAGLIACVALPFTSLWPHDHLGFMPGFRQYVRGTADMPAIQAWLSTADPNLRDAGPILVRTKDPTRAVWPDTVPWPPAIKRFDPAWVHFAQTADAWLTIRMTWSTPWNQWGVEIGPQDMEIPETQDRIERQYGPPDNPQVLYDHGEYRLPVAPGAYVWHEIR